MEEISDHKKDASAVTKNDGYLEKQGPNRSRRRTSKGRKLLVTWKENSTGWQPPTDLKESNPVQVAEYGFTNNIAEEQAVAW
jgi:hypothetical protein